jgi:hypothetical protein
LLLGRKLLGYDVDYLAVNTESEYQEIRRGDSIQRDHFTDSASSSGNQPKPARSKRLVVD